MQNQELFYRMIFKRKSLCLGNENVPFERIIHNDSKEKDDAVMTLVATYQLAR